MSTTTIIRFPQKPSERATGFFYNYNNSTFLITNRHVLEHDDEQPRKIAIYFRNHSDISEVNRCEVPLYYDEFPRWLIHPSFPEVDITALPLNQRLSHINDEDPKTGSLALSADAFANPELFIRGGTGARIFGYPVDFVDTHSYFPIARYGMIASPYGSWFDNKPQFLIDGRMGGGMSGSPVFTERTTHFEKISGETHLAGPSSFFIGVHAGNYRTPNNRQNSELNINHVWYSELIEMLLSANGLCDYVEGVEFDSEREILDSNIEIDTLSNLVSEYMTWELFDPEKNRPDSPSEFLDDEIDKESFLTILSAFSD